MLGRVAVNKKETDAGAYSGIYVSFEQSKKNKIHPNISSFSYPQTPEELIHHPKELQLITVQKIEQVIGIHDRMLKFFKGFKNFAPLKQICIFDGYTWVTPHHSELIIDVSDEKTKEEMAKFKTDDTYFWIQHKMKKIIAEVESKKIWLGSHQDQGAEPSFLSRKLFKP